jgi:hypothetical protein
VYEVVLPRFRIAYQHAGQRGFAVLVGAVAVIGPYFIWQRRSLEKARETEIQGPFDVELVSDIGLLFCPWCGKDLGRFYRRHIEAHVRPGFETPLPTSS